MTRSYYRVGVAANDTISLSDTPPPGTQFPAGNPASFAADVQYGLSTRPRGDVYLRARDQFGNLLAVSEFVRVGQGGAPLTGLRIDSFDLQSATNLTFEALLTDTDTGAILAQTSVGYAVGPSQKPPLELGTHSGFAFTPTNLTAIFANNGNLSDQIGDILTAKTHVSASPKPRHLALVMEAALGGGAAKYKVISAVVPASFDGDFFFSTQEWDAQPYVLQQLRALSVSFYILLVTPDEPEVRSDKITIPVESIFESKRSPAKNMTLGVSLPVVFTLDLTTVVSGSRTLKGVMSEGVSSARELFVDNLGTLPASPGLQLRRTNSFAITRDDSARVSLRLVNSAGTYAETEEIAINLLVPFEFSAGANPEFQGWRERLNGINSTAARSGSAIARQRNLESLAGGSSGGGQLFLAGAQNSRLFTPSCGSPFADFIGINYVCEFIPPIPADGSFSATLTLTNNPNDFPDDPNFSEAALRIFSYDPATQQLVAHPTTINLSDHTATAPITSLARYYTVGMTGPLAQASFSFPLLSTGPNLTATAQLLNRASNSAMLNLTAYHTAGTVLTNDSLTSPVAVAVSPGLTNLALAAFFNVDPDVPGWARGFGSTGVLGSFVLSSASRCEALPLPRPALQTVLPDMRLDSSGTTEVHVANSTRFLSSLVLELHDTNGLVVATNERSLGPKAVIRARLDTLFTNLPQPFAGYLTVEGDQRLAAVELLVGAKSLAALNGQTPSCATRLYAPRFTVGNGFASSIVIVNPMTNAASVTVRAINDAGANLATPASFSLGAGKQFRTNLTALLGLSTATGSLVVESSGVGLVGSVFISETNSAPTFAAAFSLITAAAPNWAIPCVPLAGSFFREISLLNTNGATASATIKFFLPNASLVSTANVAIAAGGRVTHNLGTLLPASATETNGYFMVEASAPVMVSGLTGENSGNTLSPMPAQTFAVPAVVPPSLAIQRAGNAVVLSWPSSAAGFNLQSVGALSLSNNWQSVTNLPVLDGGSYRVTNPITGSRQYFRLQRP